MAVPHIRLYSTVDACLFIAFSHRVDVDFCVICDVFRYSPYLCERNALQVDYTLHDTLLSNLISNNGHVYECQEC